jgi:hypothetical protein
MATKSFRPIETSKHAAIVLFAKLTGGGAASDLVVGGTGGPVPTDIVTAVYASATGTFTIVFRDKYPLLLAAPTFSFVGDQTGLNGKCTAIDVAAGTATFLFGYSTTPADPATTDTIYVTWTVANSGLVQ